MAVTYDANGQPQMATPSNSVILGRAGEDYNAVAAAGTKAALSSYVSQRLTDIHFQHADDGPAFLQASKTFIDGLRANSTLGPQVANGLADQAQNEASARYANIAEKSFELSTRENLQSVQTQIADTQNKMRVIARQGGMETPAYDQLQDTLQDAYGTLGSTKLFGYSPDRANSELQSAMSTMRAEDTIGKVDATFNKVGGDGGKAGAQKMLTDGILNNPDLSVSDPERKQLYAFGMAHLEYLTNNQKGLIDANRVGQDKLIERLNTGQPGIDQGVYNRALTQANSLHDAEGVMKLQAYWERYQQHLPMASLSDPARLQALTGGDYISKVGQKENATGNPNAGNGGGTFQFTPSTWAAVSRQHPELNLTPDGRTDAAQGQRAIVAFTNDNRASLQAAGIAPNDSNTYMAHFLGATGASSFIKSMQANPAAPAAASNLAAATANPSIFYKPGADGRPDPSQPRSLSEVYQLQTKNFGGLNGPTTPVMPSGNGQAPTDAQMKANPFAMVAYLDSLKTDDAANIASARNVGNTIVEGVSHGVVPPIDTTAAFMQVAQRYPKELGEIAQKVNTQAGAAGIGQNALDRPIAQGQSYMDAVTARARQSGDLTSILKAQASKEFFDKGSAQQKNDPFGNAAARNWAPPPLPLDFSNPQTSAQTVPQAIAQRSSMVPVIQAHTGQEQAPLGKKDIQDLQKGLPLADPITAQATMTALGNLPPAQASLLMSDDDFKKTVMGLAHSGDPVKMNAAYSFLDGQYRRNPAQFDATNAGELKDLRAWQALSTILPPAEVAKKMAQAADPDVIAAKKKLEDQADKDLESYTPDAAVKKLYGSWIPGMSPGQIAGDNQAPGEAGQGGAVLAQDYRSFYKDMFAETGSKDAADAYAKEKLGNKYGASAMNGGRVMAYAPDRLNPDGTGAYYPLVNGSHQWLSDQLVHDVRSTDWFADQRRRSFANAIDTTRRLLMLPDATTHADIASKRPPSYTVLAQGNDGRLHAVTGADSKPLRFRGDPSAIQAKADATFTANRAADQSIEDTMGSVPGGY